MVLTLASGGRNRYLSYRPKSAKTKKNTCDPETYVHNATMPSCPAHRTRSGTNTRQSNSYLHGVQHTILGEKQNQVLKTGAAQSADANGAKHTTLICEYLWITESILQQVLPRPGRRTARWGGACPSATAPGQRAAQLTFSRAESGTPAAMDTTRESSVRNCSISVRTAGITSGLTARTMTSAPVTTCSRAVCLADTCGLNGVLARTVGFSGEKHH